MADLFERVRRHWGKIGAGVAEATATLEEVATWEQRYQVAMPDDLREYVAQLNGTYRGEALDFGDDLISFLPLKAMVPEREFSQHHDAAHLFVFADFLISSYWWSVEVTAERRERSRIFVTGAQPKLVAESMEEFLEAYLAGVKRIYI